jgi:hypothetical protein
MLMACSNMRYFHLKAVLHKCSNTCSIFHGSIKALKMKRKEKKRKGKICVKWMGWG